MKGNVIRSVPFDDIEAEKASSTSTVEKEKSEKLKELSQKYKPDPTIPVVYDQDLTLEEQ